MKQKILNILKNEWKFKLTHFGLMIIVLLIAVTLFKYNDYTLQLPGDNLFANITFIIVIFMGIAFYFILNFLEKKNICLEKIYLTLIIPLGIMYCIANPIGKIPDEYQHARKSYMISQGILFSQKDEMGNPVGNFNSKLIEMATKSITSYEEAYNRVMMTETDEEVERTYSMATYAPICHMPQALGMFLVRVLGGGIAIQCYVARIFNMSVAIFLIYMAIKFIPFKKHIVLLLALLPITISEMASMSSDALTISMCMFYISYILHLKYCESKQKIDRRDIAVLAISSIIVSLCKIVYVPICLLIFTIPKEKFSSKKIGNIIKWGIFILSIIINLAWLIYASTFLTEVNPGVDAGEQVKYIITHPISYSLILFRTIHIYNQTFLLSLCGEGLGHYNSQASVLFTLPCLVVFVVLFLLNDDKDRKEFSIKEKLIYLAIFTSIVLLVYTSLCVAWTEVKKPIILGVQSRYFLPVLLLTAIVLDNKKIILNCKLKNKYLLSFIMFMNLNVLSNLSFMYIFNYIIEYYVK